MPSCSIVVVLVLVLAALCPTTLLAGAGGRWQQTISQKITTDKNLSQFRSLLQSDKLAKSTLYYRSVTVFAPDNEAFVKYNNASQHLASYHVAYGAKILGEFHESSLETIRSDLPPLWVTRQGGRFYVNNARVLDYPNGFVSRNRQDVYGKTQVLHVIDEVLDPFADVANPTAYDFLSRTSLWTSAHTTGVFFSAVIHNRLESFFRSEGNYTFFLPVDVVGGDYRVQFLDVYSIKAHIIPNRVLFTKPCVKLFEYDTLTAGDYISVAVSLVEDERGRFHVRGNTTLGDSNHRTGVVTSEILLANVPLKNGVVHLIGKPLALYNKKLGVFPLVTTLEKLAGDPMLNTSYAMGSNSGFNAYLALAGKKFTFFVPRDVAWRRLRDRYDVREVMKPGLYHLARQILERHLVVGEVPISMETLVSATARRSTCVNLTTPAGRMCVRAAMRDGRYELAWNGQRIVVSRPNYECVDGIVHVLDAPFMDEEDFERFGRRSAINFVEIWNAIRTLLL